MRFYHVVCDANVCLIVLYTCFNDLTLLCYVVFSHCVKHFYESHLFFYYVSMMLYVHTFGAFVTVYVFHHDDAMNWLPPVARLVLLANLEILTGINSEDVCSWSASGCAFSCCARISYNPNLI